MKYEEKIKLGQKRIMDKFIINRQILDVDFLGLAKIIAFLGGRRTGKTSIMIQLVRQYILDGIVNLDDVIFLDFGELDNASISLYDIYIYYQNLGIKPFWILDEIQEKPDFEKDLIFLYNEGCNIFISGSNSKLLSQEISTKLRGRTREYQNNVLSFREYLVFVGSQSDYISDIYIDKEIKNHFENYILWGGYPEIVMQTNKDIKLSLIKGYLDLLIYKDIMDRYNIRNQEILYQLIKTLIKSNTKNININKIYNNYKSQGLSVSKNTLYEYLGYLHNIFFVSQVYDFYNKGNLSKVYLIDNTYMNLFDDNQNFGSKFENAIYKKLVKMNLNIGFVNSSKFEIDFTDSKVNWQVCRYLNDQNIDREMAFVESSKDKKNMIIYHNKDIDIYDKQINFIDGLSFLL